MRRVWDHFPLKEISLRGVSGWTVMDGLTLRVLESTAQRVQEEFDSRESVDLWEPSRSADPCANHALDWKPLNLDHTDQCCDFTLSAFPCGKCAL